MHIDMPHLQQNFFSIAITHLLSNDLELEKLMAGKYELQMSTRLDSVLQ